MKHRDISTSHGRVPPTSPWHAAVDEGGLDGTEEVMPSSSCDTCSVRVSLLTSAPQLPGVDRNVDGEESDRE